MDLLVAILRRGAPFCPAAFSSVHRNRCAEAEPCSIRYPNIIMLDYGEDLTTSVAMSR
jgi:hypothetical protein